MTEGIGTGISSFTFLSFWSIICRRMSRMRMEWTDWDLMSVQLHLSMRVTAPSSKCMRTNYPTWLRATNQGIPTVWPVPQTYNITMSGVPSAQHTVNTPLNKRLSSLSNIFRIWSMESVWKVSDCAVLIILNFKAQLFQQGGGKKTKKQPRSNYSIT